MKKGTVKSWDEKSGKGTVQTESGGTVTISKEGTTGMRERSAPVVGQKVSVNTSHTVSGEHAHEIKPES